MQLKDAVTTFMSTVALLVSAYSFYESSLKGADLSIFVAPRIDYTDPDRPEAVREIFIMPVTIANEGARAATVMSVNLEVVNPRTKQSKTFYAARLGSWGETPLKPFAPAVVTGKSTYSQALQFEPRVGEAVPRILDLEAGGYTFKLSLDVAGGGLGSGSGTSLQFEMQTGQMDYRMFNGIGTMGMWSPNYRPATNVGR
jgi:hypothetical protein